MKILNNKNILITGGVGFIGSHLVDKLIKDGHGVAIIDNLSTGRKENLNSNAVFYGLDIQSPEVSEVFEKEKPEIIFHYAAQIDVRKSVEDPIESAKTNILGSLNILENCRKFGVKKIVFASTGGAIYGEADVIPTPESYTARPVSPYGIEKLIVEHYLDFYKKECGLDYLILRFANVYGPRQNSKGEAGVIAIFCDNILDGKNPIINGDGKQTRDFVFVNDVVSCNILGLEKNKTGVFNVGTGKETDINAIFQKINGFFGSKDKEIHVPAKKGEQQRSCLDIKKAERDLGWHPECKLEDGLKQTIKWFKTGTNRQF
ncbi:MAG: GDP-mannose 4,6-dehydratase [Candidatus Staskawiczbacteria bacterium]|nr:GDP-mannose 4,6-dehydratase [Candidatus Staskawiczbacteria bacterium]